MNCYTIFSLGTYISFMEPNLTMGVGLYGLTISSSY